MNLTPSSAASSLVTSVLPTPVGPANKYDPTGFSGSLRPARLSLMAVVSAVTASS